MFGGARVGGLLDFTTDRERHGYIAHGLHRECRYNRREHVVAWCDFSPEFTQFARNAMEQFAQTSRVALAWLCIRDDNFGARRTD